MPDKVYMCCKPGCGNILEPQGPVRALVQFGDYEFNHTIELQSSGQIDDNNLDLIHQILPGRIALKNITLKVKEPINGRLAPFQLKHMEVSFVKKKGEGTLVKHTITLFCQKCKTCCNYKT